MGPCKCGPERVPWLALLLSAFARLGVTRVDNCYAAALWLRQCHSCWRTWGSPQVFSITVRPRRNCVFLCTCVRALAPAAGAEARGDWACTPATSLDVIGSLLTATVEIHTPSSSDCESPLLPSLRNRVISDLQIFTALPRVWNIDWCGCRTFIFVSLGHSCFQWISCSYPSPILSNLSFLTFSVGIRDANFLSVSHYKYLRVCFLLWNSLFLNSGLWAWSLMLFFFSFFKKFSISAF